MRQFLLKYLLIFFLKLMAAQNEQLEECFPQTCKRTFAYDYQESGMPVDHVINRDQAFVAVTRKVYIW